MPIEINLLLLSLLPVVGFAVGVFGSYTGFGGALVMTPVLALFFRLPYNVAIACSLAQIVGIAAVGLLRHDKLGHVDLKLGLNFAVGGVPGAIVGRYVLRGVVNNFGISGGVNTGFKAFFALLLAAVVVSTLVKALRAYRRSGDARETVRRTLVKKRPAKIILVFFTGLATGLVGGSLSLGGGIMTVIVLNGVLGVPIPVAVGTSLFQMLPMSVAATIVSLGTSDLNWQVISLLLLGGIPGAVVGPWLFRKTVDRFENKPPPGEKVGC